MQFLLCTSILLHHVDECCKSIFRCCGVWSNKGKLRFILSITLVPYFEYCVILIYVMNCSFLIFVNDFLLLTWSTAMHSEARPGAYCAVQDVLLRVLQSETYLIQIIMIACGFWSIARTWNCVTLVVGLLWSLSLPVPRSRHTARPTITKLYCEQTVIVLCMKYVPWQCIETKRSWPMMWPLSLTNQLAVNSCYLICIGQRTTKITTVLISQYGGWTFSSLQKMLLKSSFSIYQAICHKKKSINFISMTKF